MATFTLREYIDVHHLTPESGGRNLDWYHPDASVYVYVKGGVIVFLDRITGTYFGLLEMHGKSQLLSEDQLNQFPKRSYAFQSDHRYS